MGRRIAAVAGAVATLWSVPGWAHTAGRALEVPAPVMPPTAAGPDLASAVWLAAAVVALALVLLAVCRRKTLGAALIVLALWMGVEAAVHSVHHLGQPAEEARCAVASMTAHTSALPSDANVCVGLLLTQTGIARDLEPAVQAHELAATHEGRAPPRLPL